MMTNLILLSIVILMALLKVSLDPSWLNKLISLVAFSILFPVILFETSKFFSFEISLHYLVVFTVLNGLILMTV